MLTRATQLSCHQQSLSGLPCEETSLPILEEPWLALSGKKSPLDDRGDDARLPLFISGKEKAFDAMPGA